MTVRIREGVDDVRRGLIPAAIYNDASAFTFVAVEGGSLHLAI